MFGRPNKRTNVTRYLFTLVDAVDGSLYSAFRDGKEIVLEHTSVSGHKEELQRIPSEGKLVPDTYNAHHALSQVTGREVRHPHVL